MTLIVTCATFQPIALTRRSSRTGSVLPTRSPTSFLTENPQGPSIQFHPTIARSPKRRRTTTTPMRKVMRKTTTITTSLDRNAMIIMTRTTKMITMMRWLAVSLLFVVACWCRCWPLGFCPISEQWKVNRQPMEKFNTSTQRSNNRLKEINSVGKRVKSWTEWCLASATNYADDDDDDWWVMDGWMMAMMMMSLFFSSDLILS